MAQLRLNRSDAMQRLQYDTLFFDLDGTLTNPARGIVNAVTHALAKRGIVVEDRDSLCRFIGPPLVDSFERFYGFSHAESLRAVADYREYFSKTGLYENEVLPGAVELLSALEAKGRKLVIASSKPEPFVHRILDFFDLTAFFTAIHGATMDETRNQKDQVIAWALTHSGEIGAAVMVGDRCHDIIGARANGLDSIGVLCGFGSEAELRDAGATYVVKDLQALKTLLG